MGMGMGIVGLVMGMGMDEIIASWYGPPGFQVETSHGWHRVQATQDAQYQHVRISGTESHAHTSHVIVGMAIEMPSISS